MSNHEWKLLEIQTEGYDDFVHSKNADRLLLYINRESSHSNRDMTTA